MNLSYSRIIGGRILEGDVLVSGSKNASLPIIAATLLTTETCILHNIPDLTDVLIMLETLRHLGADVRRLAKNSWAITAKNIGFQVKTEFVQRLRASVCLMGALLGRERRAIVATPGGCKLGGERPIDLHLRAFEALGAQTEFRGDYVHIQAKRLTGTTLSMQGQRGPTMTGTSNAIMAAVLAEGITTIQHAAQEPEIVDVCNLLNQMGAKISEIGSDTLSIRGVNALHGTEFTAPPDRMEAGTFIILGFLCGGPIRITGISADFLRSTFHDFFESIPSSLDHCHWEGEFLKVDQIKNLPSLDIRTVPYPGFPTDLQPQITVLASQANGVSRIKDTVFPQRFVHVPEFERLGMKIQPGDGSIALTGPTSLHGSYVAATDLRAGASLYLAGLIAHGETCVTKLEHVDRGYEDFEAKLQALGAIVERIQTT